ncbi:hypothetical protein ACKI1I_01060 [Streptomyces turgidiscabies]|nr:MULTISPECIES: hypothetical protein [Streptomyces]MDX3492514.1 hypothetical protein [Streptomyces turgidiscabies]GAQ69192.1 hypothetical protein T45_00914 [Streptomyces turgidiscabies]
MGQRAQATAGCLTVALGVGAGLTVWTVRAQGRVRRFEQEPVWSVFYAELPLLFLAGTATGLVAWAVARGLGARFRARRSGPQAP